jgi:hypothetical protein
VASTTPDRLATDAIHRGRAVATVEAFLQAVYCPKHPKNAWLFLKKEVEDVNKAQSMTSYAADDKY